MWCWRRMELFSWTDRVKNEQVSYTVEQERKNLHTIKHRNANWTGHIMCTNCLLNTFLKKTQKERYDIQKDEEEEKM
jgi:hypothetical protein